jgi:hypothetical protein
VRRHLVAICVLWTIIAGGQSLADDRDQVAVELTDGGRLVGAIVREDEGTVTLRTTSGLELELARAAIANVGPASPSIPPVRPDSAATEPSEPDDTRLMFAPTGRPLGKGDGYFSDHYVVFPGFAYGLTDNLSLSGGVSIVPGLNLKEQVFYVSSTAGWRLSKKAAFSVGGLYAKSAEFSEAGALLFGVASFGSSDRSLSLGLGLAATRNEESLYDANDNYLGSTRRWSFRDAPVLMVGGSLRVGKRLSLLTESWLFPGDGFELSQQPFGLAIRFFGERLSVDAGLVLIADVLDEGFPVPWLSFSYHFGPSRSAAKRSAHASPPGFDPRRMRHR